MTQPELAPCQCNGQGATSYIEHGDKFTVHGTRLCECRRSMPPRDGTAHWWTLEPIFRAEISLTEDPIEVIVQAEVPVSEDNYRVHRRGNRYYPTDIDVRRKGSDCKYCLSPTQAREFAAALLNAADACDVIDLPDTDLCGHWAPCSCYTKHSRLSAILKGDDMSDYQRCRKCGRRWPSYRTDRWDKGLFAVLIRLPIFWWHFHFGCEAR